MDTQKLKELIKDRQWGDLIDPDDPTKGKYFPLHEFQLKVYHSNTRFTAAIAGTGGGKTVTGPVWLSRIITEHFNDLKRGRKPFMGMVVAPTYKVLSRATIPTLIDTFKGTALEGRYRESDNLYLLPNINNVKGSKLWCQGADNPGGLEGGQFDAIWGDEAGQFKLSVWSAVQGRTGAKQAPILLTTTPYGKNWLYSEFYKRAVNGDKDYMVVQWASKVNPAYPEEEYNRAKRTMNKELAEMRYDGAFTSLQGLVYPDMSRCYVRMSRSSLEDLLSGEGRFVGGIDFGWNDPFCALCGFLDVDDVLWVWFERYRAKKTIEDHADKLPKFFGRSMKWYADHEPDHIYRLKKGGHVVVKANKSIIPGIEAVNSRIYNNKLRVVSNRCIALQAEAEVYMYPETEDESGGDKPIDADNHAMDALRYMVSGIDLKRAA